MLILQQKVHFNQFTLRSWSVMEIGMLKQFSIPHSGHLFAIVFNGIVSPHSL